MIRAAVIALSLAVSACSPEVIGLELPSRAGYKSAIVGLEYQGVLKFSAIRLDPFEHAELLPFVRSAESAVAMWALYYRDSLEDLELIEGELVATTDARRARPIPTPSSIFRAEVTENNSPEWSTAPLDSKITDYRFAALDELCPEYEVRAYSINSGSTITALTKIDDETVLAAALNGDFWRVGAEGITPLPSIIGFAPSGAWTAPDGELWIVSLDGHLFRGHAGGDFISAGRNTEDPRLRWIDGPRTGPAFELFAVSYDGGFSRFDGSTSQWEIFVPKSEIMTDSLKGGVVWIAPGEAVAVPPQESSVDVVYYHRRPNQLPGQVDRSLIAAIRGDVSAITYVEKLGIIALTKLSAVIKADRDTFTTYDEAPVIGESHALMAYRRGFVYAGEGISFVEYHPLVGFCPKVDYATAVFPRVIAPLGRGFVITGDAHQGTENQILVVQAK